MKLLTFPYESDPILNRIDSLKKHLREDDTGDYLDELLLIIEEYCREYPTGEYPEIDKLEAKISEARFWLNEFITICEENTE